MEKYYGGVKLMQITSCKITNTKYMQIYLTEEELEKQQTKEKYSDVLEKIVTKQVGLKNNVC